MKKNTNTEDFPLVYKWNGRDMQEAIPVMRDFMFPLWAFRARMLRKITGNTSYFHLRAGYDLKRRKQMDLAFVWHYMNVHEGSLIKAALSERLRYRRYWRKYCVEIKWITSQLKDQKNVPVEATNYIKRYDFGVDTDPFMVEYFHGMDGERFMEYERMYPTDLAQ